MGNIQWVILVFAIVFNAAANIFIKMGMNGMNILGGGVLQGICKIILNIHVIIGGLCFGIALLLYSVVLSKMDLSLAYPIMTGSGFIIVLLASLMLFGEPFLLNRLFGIILIIAGISVVAMK